MGLIKQKICQNITSKFNNPKQSIPLKVQKAPKLRVEKRDKSQQCAIMIGYPTTTRYNASEMYALNIAANILGGGLSSRLFMAVRENAGLAYTIKADTIFYQDTGLFMITTAIEKNSLLFNKIDTSKPDITNVKQDNIHSHSQINNETIIKEGGKKNKTGGLSIILKVMEDILRDGVTDEELIRAKTNIVNKLAMSYENTHTIAMYYNEMVMMEHSPIISINDFIKGIKNIKLKDVNEVIRKYLSFDKMTICIVGNYTEKQILDYLSTQFLK